jgi:hypothetical protein
MILGAAPDYAFPPMRLEIIGYSRRFGTVRMPFPAFGAWWNVDESACHLRFDKVPSTLRKGVFVFNVKN